MSCADFGVAAGALQLFVPSYGLRLIRRFGTNRIGWFMVTAFVSLAALHLLEPTMKPGNGGISPDLLLNLVYGIGSVLLLVGMGHIETFFSQFDRARSNEESLSSHWQAQVQKETSGLARENEALQQELARHKQAEAALRESDAQYRFAFTENPQPMWVLDLRESRFIAVNKAALRHYGFTPEEFMRLAPQDLLPSEQVEAFKKNMSVSCTRAESRAQWKHYRKDHAVIDVEVAARDFSYSGAPARLMVINDLSEQRRRAYEEFRATKMDLVSRMAGGTACHVNNVLVAIENHATSLRQKTRDPALTSALQDMSLVANQGNNFAYQMLAISGQQAMQARPLDLNRLITNLNLILRRITGDKIIFQNLCGSNPLPVMADPQVMEHIMINLVKNARDAIETNGTVAISTAVVRIERPPVKRDQETTDFVRITVRDTGSGMSPEIQECLYEPFFTTKEPGKASGLGLAGVYGAVRQLWGWIECTSAEGQGTEFRIFLPCVSEALLTSVTEIQAATTMDRGTVLLVDPDDRSRGVARYLLNRHGYRVIEADAGDIALLLWEGQARTIDLLVTELTLPGETGVELANRLRQSRPDLKVIYACSQLEGTRKPEVPEGSSVLPKPYRPDSFIESVEASIPAR